MCHIESQSSMKAIHRCKKNWLLLGCVVGYGANPQVRLDYSEIFTAITEARMKNVFFEAMGKVLPETHQNYREKNVKRHSSFFVTSPLQLSSGETILNDTWTFPALKK